MPPSLGAFFYSIDSMSKSPEYNSTINAVVYYDYLPPSLHVGYSDGVNVEEIITPGLTRYLVTEVK